MNDVPNTGDREIPEPRYEVWLAERELLAAATAVRDLGATARSPARIAYEAAWMRFMVALCNLPIADRPYEVDRMIESLRVAHVMQSRGELADVATPEPSVRANVRSGPIVPPNDQLNP